jgi:predicted unusual protein kinase regulating ubiquinone biosynthesis (AarF/ABC1/UbiB family)
MSRGTSAAGRAAKVIGMTGGVSGSYIGYLLQSLFLDDDARATKLKGVRSKAARRVADELGTMRGPLMKLGQTLSIQGMLPPEIIEELADLQMSAPGMHYSLVRAQMKAALGDYPENIFKSFEPKPFAAASLGQVHHAVTKAGAKVVVKVQYPDIAAAIRNDFRLLRTAALPAGLSKHIPAGLIDELETQIAAETDYRREAANIAFFRAALADQTIVAMPEVYEEYSAERVLTMSPVAGDHLEAFLAKRPTQAARDRVGTNLMKLFFHQLLHVGAFHADPHWGNYLLQRDGTIGLIDFGCVKYVQPAFVENLRRLFLYPGPRDSAEFRRLLDERYALLKGSITPRATEALVQFSQNFYGKVYPPGIESDDVAFDFSDEACIRDFTRECNRIVRAKGMLPEYVFLGRTEAGLYQMLHRLGARVHTSRIVRPYITPPS